MYRGVWLAYEGPLLVNDHLDHDSVGDLGSVAVASVAGTAISG